MSVTFIADTGEARYIVIEPCLCAQMSPVWGSVYEGDSDDFDALAEHADPDCVGCHGYGVEPVLWEQRPSMNVANMNACALTAALGLPEGQGECTIHDARRAVIRARNTDISAHAFKTEQHSRAYVIGLDLDRLGERIDEFAKMVEEGAEKGAKRVLWS